jgi:hypothetical protein
MIPLYTWSGSYCAFLSSNRIFDANSKYLGWLDDEGRAWHANGQYWGKLTNENYILRRTSMVTPVSRTPRPHPITPISPIRRLQRYSSPPKTGYIDALKDI